MLLAKIVKLYCMVRYPSLRLHLKVYRVCEHQPNFVSHSVVFEETQTRRFIQRSSNSYPTYDNEESGTREMEEIDSLSDAISAIESLTIDLPLEMGRNCWETEGRSTIDAAIAKGQAEAEEIFSRVSSESINEQGIGMEENGRGRLGAYMTVEYWPEEEVRLDEWARRLSKELRRKAGGKEVRWRRIGQTADGRDCHILVIDGIEEHCVP